MSRRWRPSTLALAGASLVLLASACGDDDEPAAERSEAPPAATVTEEPAPAPATPAKPTGTTIRLMESDFGTILADSKRQAIYLFTREKDAESRCYGECAVEWPPVLTKGAPRAAPGIDADGLGTTKRRGGRTQVTYNGHPLYYWYKDPPGEVLCQAVEEFGGFWYVVDKSGDAIT